MAKRQNYLNNKELLKEIHKSKVSYSSFTRPEYAHYDGICQSREEITPEFIQKVKDDKAKKEIKEKKQELRDEGVKAPKVNIDPEEINTEGLIIRVMEHEHIPHDETRVKRAKKPLDEKVKCIFPPFKHYYVHSDLSLEEVGRSHWQGSLSNGYFSQEHGQMTNRLASMCMQLVERYGQRGNWRGYCVDENTEALTKRGWLSMDEITLNDEIMSWSDGKLVWSKLLDIYRDDYSGYMHKLSTKQGIDMLVTPGHKIQTERGLVPVEYLKESDRIILGGDSVETVTEPMYSDAFVELCGWILTEGCYDTDGKGIKNIDIYQNAGEKADRIRSCLNALEYTYSEHGEKLKCFKIWRRNCWDIAEVLPEKELRMDFIHSLTQDQRILLINTMIDGDGWRRGPNKTNLSYTQKCKKHVDAFVALCFMSGIRSRTIFCDNKISFGKPTSYYTLNLYTKRKNYTRVECVDFHGGKRTGRDTRCTGKGKLHHPNVPTQWYDGRIWCPKTEFGTFVARRNGTVYVTGNTYLDEMKSQALFQLAQIALQFDESRSETPNPFAYYTAAITNSFTRVLNLEKKNQNIRDDILQMHDITPSYTRQVEDSMNTGNDKK